MDESQLASVLSTMAPDEIDAAADEFHGFARHLRVQANLPAGVAAAPFNFKAFFKNAIKLIQVVYPVVAPLVGLDTAAADPSRSE